MIRKNAFYPGIFALLLLAAGCNQTRPSYSSESTTPVWLEDVSRRTIREITTTTGTAKAAATVEVKSEVNGKYHLQNNPKTGKPFKMGDIVELGTELIRLENPTAVNNISLPTKKMDVQIAESEWKGQQKVFELGGATEKEVLNAEKSYIQSKTSLEEAEREMDKLMVKAPFKGVITKLPYFTPGVEIASGEILFEIKDYAHMYMEIELPETAIAKVEMGQAVLVTNYNFKSDTLTGRVTQLSPAINETTRTFSGFITIDNPELLLRPGMLAKGEIITLQKDSVLAVPKEIVRTNRQRKMVYTVERNMANEIGLSTGISDDKWIEVTGGLKDGDKIVVRGYNYLRHRSPVKIMK